MLAFAALLPLAGIGTARAASEDAKTVTKAVQSAVNAIAPPHAVITLGPVTGAQYMKPCQRPLAVTISGTQPYLQAAVLCTEPRWTLYVSAEVEAKIAVVVAAQTIPAGQPIRAEDVKLTEEPMSSFAGRQVFYHTDDVLGDVADLTLPAGTLIVGTSVQRPILVRPGQIIMVDVRNAGIDVTLDARADETGRLGDMIAVTNLSSGKTFQATVTPSGALVDLQP
ncbi:flagellar basal body P-ring biosynthesis protein FlgA [Acidisoma sp. C75]